MPTTWSGPRRFDMMRTGSCGFLVLGQPTGAVGPRTDRLTVFDIPLKDAVPYVVRVDHGSRQLWIGTSAGDALLRCDPAAKPGRSIRCQVVGRSSGIWPSTRARMTSGLHTVHRPRRFQPRSPACRYFGDCRARLGSRIAAVDEQHGARYIGRRIGREEHHRAD